MKTLKLTILFIAFISIGHSQNLVPNPSFEDTLFCPFVHGQINSLTNWFMAAGNPDSYNICSPPPYVSVPHNFSGYQLAATGNGYTGLLPYYSQSENLREYLGVQLTTPLIINTKYYISFKVVRADNSSLNCACNNLGVFFSNDFYDGMTDTLKVNNSPQVYSTQVLVDTLNWTSLNFTYLPDSNYSFLYIGNFFSDSLTTIQQMGPYCVPYYYIDDVYVSPDSLTSINNEFDDTEFAVFPNPTQDIVTVQNSQHRSVEIEIYNYLGVLLKKIDSTNDEKITLDISELSQGLYFINLRSDNNVKFVRKITKL